MAAKYCIADGGLPADRRRGLAVRDQPAGCGVGLHSRQGQALAGFGEAGDWVAALAPRHLTAIQIGTFNWGTSHSEAGRSSIFINIHTLVVGASGLADPGGAPRPPGVARPGIGRRWGWVIILAKQLWLGGGLLGDLVVLASAVVFAIQTIAQKLTFPRIPARTLLFSQSLVALAISTV